MPDIADLYDGDVALRQSVYNRLRKLDLVTQDQSAWMVHYFSWLVGRDKEHVFRIDMACTERERHICRMLLGDHAVTIHRALVLNRDCEWVPPVTMEWEL